MAPDHPRASGRRRVTHSLEAVVEAAVSLLDESGEAALTFRALASRLGGGVASIYWYVSSRDELLDRAADHVLAGVLEQSRPMAEGPDPIENVRQMSLVLFDEMVRRPWLGTLVISNSGVQANSIRFLELLGQQLMRLDLTARQRFHAASSVISYVVGVAVDMGQPPPAEFLASGLEPREFMAMYADRWRASDPAEFPFLHHIADEFEQHRDEDVFRSGLDLLLVGLRRQAGA
jgi:AcrR family transcriptional regulator